MKSKKQVVRINHYKDDKFTHSEDEMRMVYFPQKGHPFVRWMEGKREAVQKDGVWHIAIDTYTIKEDISFDAVKKAMVMKRLEIDGIPNHVRELVGLLLDYNDDLFEMMKVIDQTLGFDDFPREDSAKAFELAEKYRKAWS